MPYSDIENTLSTSRFLTYRNAIEATFDEDDLQMAVELYQWNAELSSRFFFPLHIYEVMLRNAISEAISLRYGQDWPINTVFVNSLNGLDRNTLSKAIGGNYLGVGKLLPELKFVFFENMLTSRHDGRIWNRYIHDIFPFSPAMSAAQLRSTLKSSCYKIRKFRNRCGHHEPIFNNQYLDEIYPLIEDSIKWRNHNTYLWLHQNETVTPLLSEPII